MHAAPAPTAAAAASPADAAPAKKARGYGASASGPNNRAFSAALGELRAEAAIPPRARPAAAVATSPPGSGPRAGAKGFTNAPAAASPPARAETPSRALRIDGLTRPFTVKQLRDLLSVHGTIAADALWLPQLKTHCVVVFDDEAGAAAARTAVDGLQWPQGSAKVLAPQYISLDEAQATIDGTAAAAAAATAAVATAAGKAAKAAAQAPARIVELVRGGAAAAGAARERNGAPVRAAEIARPPRERVQSLARVPSPPPPPPPPKSLDDLFLKTKTKPQLYYLPLTDAEVTKKQGARRAQQERYGRQGGTTQGGGSQRGGAGAQGPEDGTAKPEAAAAAAPGEGQAAGAAAEPANGDAAAENATAEPVAAAAEPVAAAEKGDEGDTVQ